MVQLTVTIKLKEPILLGGPRSAVTAQVQETMRYITGSVIRGAVGALLAQAGHHKQHEGQVDPSCPFCRVFLLGTPPRFGPCYPVGHSTSASRPFPATARSCKHYPGFKQCQDADMHGIRDILFRQWAVETAFEQYGHILEEYPFRCHVRTKGQDSDLPEATEQCEVDLEPTGVGFYEHVDINFFQPRVWIQRFSRVAIDRHRHVAADQLLYTLEVIGEEMDSGRRQDGRVIKGPTIFKGYVWAEVEADLLKKTLERVDHLGGDTSRGLGAVQVSVEKPRSIPVLTFSETDMQQFVEVIRNGNFATNIKKNDNSIIARLTQFNAKLREVARNVAPSMEKYFTKDVLFFSVDLLSDTVWIENGLSIALLPETLAGARRVRSWATAHPHGGWHTAAQMMRRTYLAIDAGSVFLYQLDNASDLAILTVTLNTLAQFEREGLGRERERGYGWIEICSPFHLEVEPK